MIQVDERILLTVDDGPSEKTGELLHYLEANRIGAILFSQGDNLEKRYELAVRAVKAGYIIGNHSYSHPKFGILTEEKAKEEIAKSDKLIDLVYAGAGEQRPANYFRFPYGRPGDQSNQRFLQEFCYWSPIDTSRNDWTWDVAVEDWRVSTSNVGQKLQLAKKKLTTDLQQGNVLLLHDHPANFELELFQGICQHVLDLGFTFWTNEEFQEQALTGPQ